MDGREIQGSRENQGSKAQGLHQLKLYLARFGYLNYQHTPYHTNVEDDKFDDELESALKSYQKYYHLNATGTLDEATVSLLTTPRCGCPDKETHNHTSKLHIVSRYTFFPNKPRWPPSKSHLTYAFTSNYPNNHVPPVVRAFNQWSSASGYYFKFSRVYDVRGADLKISFERGNHGDNNNFDGPGRVLAHAYAPTDGRLHFDADDTFSDGPRAVQNVMDLETVAVHEIGHLLGLGHSNDKNAIMYAYITSGVLKGLNSDDIQGIKALYGLTN
ncbi:hypothetical protein L6452_41619 [Arctium lappa]|uniref:Uncharacterized protein n=1 Tax=Arctium lappa TaxID=4217 RepID=A0ACB8XP93_ARCLA|nr:hypothetical protein L6452_41619 [Arctium lappa]